VLSSAIVEVLLSSVWTFNKRGRSLHVDGCMLFNC